MTTSVIQLKANQANAKKSTGPITPQGKQVVANNAVKHGLFAKQLLLSDENPAEFQLLLEGLQVGLNPIGTLEQSLVERIAVSLWRQQRLVRSETAHIEMGNKPNIITAAVNAELGGAASSISEYDLDGFDLEHDQWCQSVYEEFKAIANGNDTLGILTDLDKLKQHAPTVYQHLQNDAAEEQQTIADFLKTYDNPTDYFTDLLTFCQDEMASAKQRPLVLEIAQRVRNKRAIIQQGPLRDALAKYQVMLDNELYKAIKALREAQAWRLDALQAIPE